MTCNVRAGRPWQVAFAIREHSRRPTVLRRSDTMHALLCSLACVSRATLTPIAPSSMNPSIRRPAVEALAHCCGVFVLAAVTSEVVLALFSVLVR